MMTPHQLVVEAKAQIQEVTVAGALQLLTEGIVVIDVREPYEFEAGNLPGSINIPRGILEFKTPDHPALANRQAKILLYCRTGGRSAMAAHSLQRLGYFQPVSMDGGYEAWVAHHQAIIKDNTDFS